jgi:uncharacterized membrane protein YqhA
MGSFGRSVEAILWHSRHTVVVSVIASLIAAVCVFFTTTVDVVRLVVESASYARPLESVARSDLHDGLTAHAVEVVDGYLLAAALLVFALGLYEIFIAPIQRARTGNVKLLVIETFDDLKNQLGKVIVLILVVNLFRDALAVRLTRALDLVYQGAAIALIGVALYLGHVSESRRPRTEQRELER